MAARATRGCSILNEDGARTWEIDFLRSGDDFLSQKLFEMTMKRIFLNFWGLGAELQIHGEFSGSDPLQGLLHGPDSHSQKKFFRHFK